MYAFWMNGSVATASIVRPSVGKRFSDVTKTQLGPVTRFRFLTNNLNGNLRNDGDTVLGGQIVLPLPTPVIAPSPGAPGNDKRSGLDSIMFQALTTVGAATTRITGINVFDGTTNIGSAGGLGLSGTVGTSPNGFFRFTLVDPKPSINLGVCAILDVDLLTTGPLQDPNIFAQVDLVTFGADFIS